MRCHFANEFFDTHFPPHLGPWSHFACGGRNRPPFGMPGWPRFDRCPRTFGPPGPHPHHDGNEPGRCRPGSPHEDRPGHGCGRRGPPEDRHGSSHHDHHGPRHHEHYGPPGHDHHGPPHDDHHGPPRCGRPGPPHEPPRCNKRRPDCECDRDRSPERGPPRHGHHHWRPEGFGPRDPRDFFDWPGFGPDRHFGRRFRHRGPYERPPPRDCEDCQGTPCCSRRKGNRDRNEVKGKKNGPCGARNTDQNATDTIFVERVIVDRAATRPRSV